MSSSHNQIWLSIDNDDGSIKEGFQIPYNPEEFTIVEGTNEKTVNVAGAGSVTVKTGKSPVSLNFSSVFTLNVEPGIELENPSDMKTPDQYDAMLRKWKNDSRPIHLIITNTNINAYFTISTYTASQSGGNVGQITYTLAFKQYGSASVDGASGGSGIGGLGGGGLVRRIDIDVYNLPTVPDTYIVQNKDTLQTIAKQFYNDISMAYEIYKLNTTLLKQGVNTKLKKKWVLYLPQPKK